MDKVLKMAVVAAVVAAICGMGAYANCGTCDSKAKEGDAKKAQTKCEGRFKTVDADSDGKVSKAEFTAACAKCVTAAGSEACSQEEMDKRFVAMDADKDGSLTKKEMAAASKQCGASCKGGAKKDKAAKQ